MSLTIANRSKSLTEFGVILLCSALPMWLAGRSFCNYIHQITGFAGYYTNREHFGLPPPHSWCGRHMWVAPKGRTFHWSQEFIAFTASRFLPRKWIHLSVEGRAHKAHFKSINKGIRQTAAFDWVTEWGLGPKYINIPSAAIALSFSKDWRRMWLSSSQLWTGETSLWII